MKFNPRALALSGAIATLVSGGVYKIGMMVVDPTSEQAQMPNFANQIITREFDPKDPSKIVLVKTTDNKDALPNFIISQICCIHLYVCSHNLYAS